SSASADPKSLPQVPDHTLTIISGRPRERGRQYGQKFKNQIGSFLDEMGYHSPYLKNPPPREEMLRYADRCAKEYKNYAPLIHDELEGMAEGSGQNLEEVVLLTLNEELYQQGILPQSDHCTVFAAGAPDTRDESTYIGQNWDWPYPLYGKS